MNVWFEIECPACGKVNWINNGDPSDLSRPDVEACKCWECGLDIDLETEGPAPADLKKQHAPGLPRIQMYIEQGQERPE